ncbi:UNVERIFIED_CONTAM: hypothetical protein Cloal_1695 [Acetivibrio alkalicellulosi]
MKRLFKIKFILFLFLFLVLVIHFLPMLFLKTPKMIFKESDNFIFYYEKQDEKAIHDIEKILENNINRINEKLEFEDEKKTNVYVYPNQKKMQIRKYGYFTILLNLEWYIGDNIRDKILLVSPSNSGKTHSYDSIIEAAPHEYVHTVVYRINPKTPLWINEGVALFLTNGTYNDLTGYRIPTFKDTQSNSPLVFARSNGYDFAHLYIQYIEDEYGFHKVNELIRFGGDVNKVFEKSAVDIYDEWIKTL